MRRFLRRLAWLFARLLLVVALCFGVLSTATHSSRDDWKTDRIENLQLPRYFNPSPVDLATRVRRLVDRYNVGNSAYADTEFERLGGAAFPIVLSHWSKCRPEVRERIAWALVPVIRRMGWRGASELHTPTAAEQFLTRAWQERSADFQPNIVTRWVQRLAQRANPELRASVIEYDSYALPALMMALPTINTEADAQTAQRITEVASRVTGLGWVVLRGNTASQAQEVVEHWKRWWQLHASEYVVLSGPSRWSAMLSETQFGRWLSLATYYTFGTTRDNARIIAALVPAATRTITLLFATMIGVWFVTFLPALRPRGLARWHLGVFDSVGQGLFAMPPIAVVALLAAVMPNRWSLLTAALTVAFATTLSDLGTRLSIPVAQSDVSFRLSHVPSVDRRSRSPFLRLLRQWQFAGHSLPFALLLVFVTERAYGIVGLSSLSVVAFHQRDLHCLMAITTTTAACLLFVEFAVQWRRKDSTAKTAVTPKDG